MMIIQQTENPDKTTYSSVKENRCPVDDCKAVKKLNGVISSLQEIISQKDEEIDHLNKIITHLKGKNNQLNHKLFTPSTEQTSTDDKQNKQPKDQPQEQETTTPGDDDPSKKKNDDPSQTKDETKKRGAKDGHEGHGRNIPEDLPTVVEEHEIPDEEKVCPVCGLPYRDVNLSEDSVEIDCEVKVTKTIHKRKKAVKTCDCEVPTFLTASKPAQVIPKSMYSNSFWANILVNKYYLQIPLNRQLEHFKMNGLDGNLSTLTGGFKKLMPLFEPLYERLVEISHDDIHWHADETRWMVFKEIPEKDNHRWWLWTFITNRVVIYILDPSRSSKVPDDYFTEDASGKIVVDRFPSYNCLDDRLTRCLCWDHLRRDFINAQKYSKDLVDWAQEWIDEIHQIRKINEARVEAYENHDETTFLQKQALLEKHMEDFIDKAEKQLELPELMDKQLTILKSLKRNWEHYRVFVEDPRVPMDNNLAERILRNPALGRKVYYGHHSQWGGEFATMCMSIFQTAKLNDLLVLPYTLYYIEACAEAGGVPENIDDFLPWNIPDEVLEEYGMKLGKKPP